MTTLTTAAVYQRYILVWMYTKKGRLAITKQMFLITKQTCLITKPSLCRLMPVVFKTNMDAGNARREAVRLQPGCGRE